MKGLATRLATNLKAWSSRASILIQKYVDRGHDLGRLPILWTDNFAGQAAIAIYQVGFRIHRSAIVFRDLLGGVAVRGEDDMVVLEEFFVSGAVLIHTHSEDKAASLSNVLLEPVQGLSLFEARRTPRGPKIHKHNFAVQVGKPRGPSFVLEGEVFGPTSGKAGFALAIRGGREDIQNRGGDHQRENAWDLVLQRFNSPHYDTFSAGLCASRFAARLIR